MLLTGVSSPSLLFLRAQFFKLPDTPIPVERLHPNLIDPYDPEQGHIVFTNSIGFNGKFYALSLHGALAVIEDVDSRFVVTGMGKNRAVPTVASRRLIEYLIESDGEILLVFLISRKSMIDYVEVMKLDFSTMSWVKLDELGDGALFLPGTGRGIAVNANQVAGKISEQSFYERNRVYFTHQGINCWKEFDFASKIIVSDDS